LDVSTPPVSILTMLVPNPAIMPPPPNPPATKLRALVTFAPFSIMRVPVLPRPGPTTKLEIVKRLEVGPFTITVPAPPAVPRNRLLPAVNRPPSSMVREPVPLAPTTKFGNPGWGRYAEPGPFTVTSPTLPV
jgi:hypothetical protein